MLLFKALLIGGVTGCAFAVSWVVMDLYVFHLSATLPGVIAAGRWSALEATGDIAPIAVCGLVGFAWRFRSTIQRSSDQWR